MRAQCAPRALAWQPSVDGCSIDKRQNTDDTEHMPRLDENAIRRLVRLAPTIAAENWQRGCAFYPEHADWLASLAAETNHCPRAVRAASARHSARTMYARERLAVAAQCRGESKPSGILGMNWKFAGIALAGDIDRALPATAPKIRAYDAAIGGDESRAVIDTWMAKWLGCPQPTNEREYARCERIFQAAARRLGWCTPRDLQAAVWYHMRGEKPSDRKDV